MTTDAVKHLRLQSWFSPAFPIGAFSYSHGLEWAVEDGSVRDRESLVAWLEADLRHGSGRVDAMLFAQVWRAVGPAAPSPGMLTHSALSPRRTLVVRRKGSRSGRGHAPRVAVEGAVNAGHSENDCGIESSSPLPSRERAATQSPGEVEHAAKLVDGARYATVLAPPHSQPGCSSGCNILHVAELAAAMRGTAELVLESGQQGIAFLGAVRKAWPHAELDCLANLLSHAAITPVLPVAAAMCCAVHDIGLDLALPLYVHGAAANLVNAAVRLIPLGQTDGQIAIAALEPAVLEVAREAASADPGEIGSAAFMIDLASMAHETQYTRLFRS